MEMEFITLQIEKELKEQLEEKFRAEERDMSKGIRWLIKRYLEEKEGD